MCAALPDEVEHKGVEGEAMHLLGPVANPQAWQQRGRNGHRYTADARLGENHPDWVLATWEMVYRIEFKHDDSGLFELGGAWNYLDEQLSRMASWLDVPFEDFARDLRACLTHLESVLSDSERGERTNIDCLDCGGALERKLGKAGFEDFATCRQCRRRYTGPEYAFAVKAHYIAEADWLSDEDMNTRTKVAAATVRSWARAPKDGSDPLVAKDVQLGRVVYSVADVERVRDEKGLAPCA